LKTIFCPRNTPIRRKKENYFDFGFIFFVSFVSTKGIEHLENSFNFPRDIRRVLKPGAELVLTTPNISGIRSRVRYFCSGFHNQDQRPLRNTVAVSETAFRRFSAAGCEREV